MHADDSPEGHGRGALSSFFIGKDKIGVIGLNGMFVYALDGTFLQKYKEFAAANFIGDPGHRVAAANQDGMMAVGFTKREDYTFDKDKIDSFYQLMKPFHFYKLDEKPVNKEEVKAGLIASFPYPTAEVYAPGFNMLKNQTAPQIGWNLERDQISVLYPEVPLLEHYDMKTGAFVKAVDLAPDHFKNPEEMPMSADDPEWFDWYNNGGWFANSYYRDLVEIGDYSLLRYTPAVPDSEVEMLMKTGGTYNNPEWVRIQKEHFNSYYQLFRDDEKIAPDFQIPAFEILEGQNGFGSRFGAIRGQIIGGPSLNRIFVFAPNDEDIERDYELIRVYRLAVN